MGTVQFVGAVDHHDKQAVQGLLIADQEGQEIPGRTVGPVGILDDHDHRAGVGQLFEQHEYLLEQPGPGLARVTARGRLAELRQQPGQFPGRAAGQQGGDAVGAEITDQLAQHGRERGERQAVHAELQAPSGQHACALAPGPLPELAYQAGLADPGLPADQDRGRVAAARLGQCGIQHGKLAGPADQDGTGYTHRHTSKHASRRRQTTTLTIRGDAARTPAG